jgi:hypothetical protein
MKFSRKFKERRLLLKLFCLALLIFEFYSCSPVKSISIPDKKAITGWMTETKVPTVGICIIEDGNVKESKVYGNIRYHSPAPVNTISILHHCPNCYCQPLP